MEILVYTAQRWQVSTWRMFSLMTEMFPYIEANVLTCPNLTHETFPYERLAQADIVYFRLHGMADQPFLYGQGIIGGWQTAFSNEIFSASGVEMRGQATVFMEGCFNALTGAPDAFIQAGANEVIAANTQTWNGTLRPGPAAKIGMKAIEAWMSGRSAANDVQLAAVQERKYRMSFARYGAQRR
jgi:hypothetical protein